jgi:hypothetical protein
LQPVILVVTSKHRKYQRSPVAVSIKALLTISSPQPPTKSYLFVYLLHFTGDRRPPRTYTELASSWHGDCL